MFRRLRTLWKPEMYHGTPESKNYFEGWYFKIVDKSMEHAFAVIPGVSLGQNEEKHHSFIQVLEGNDATSTYHTFPFSDFKSSDQSFQVAIGPNRFSLDGMKLSLAGDGQRVSGTLAFKGIIPWPVTWMSPGVMGPFQFIPLMETYHGILGFDHALEGILSFDGREIEFTGGRGYIEKDWGRSFPNSWIWMQSNHFDTPGISFTASIAVVSWLGHGFPGFLAGFLHDGVIYRFASYTGARVSNLRASESEVHFQISDKNHAVLVDAKKTRSGKLRSPAKGLMTGRILESLDATIRVRFYKAHKKRWSQVFDERGRRGGLEIVNDITRLGGSPL